MAAASRLARLGRGLVPSGLRRLGAVIGSSLRYKLLTLVLFPLLVALPVVLGLALSWSQSFSYNQLILKVTTDLAVAHDVFLRIQDDVLDELEGLAQSYAFRDALNRQDFNALNTEVRVANNTSGFDFLHLTDLEGRWLHERESGRARGSPLLVRARLGEPSVGVEIYTRAELLAESEDLARRVRLALVDTERATPTDRTVEDRAMVLRAIYPVRDSDGETLYLLEGGVLLNNNFRFVDAIRDLVYAPGSIAEGSWGTVTVFLDDVRISTNVPLEQGERALGTRVSAEVRDRVLNQGEKWFDRAFVVNDWYISGYEPIVDVYGQRVGMLYAGYLEAPFSQAYFRALAILLGLLAAVTLLAAALAVRGAKSIFKPVEQMMAVVRAHQRGENRRIGRVDSRDEIGELARQFDALLEQLNEHSRSIQRAADELELKVQERTRELIDRNQRLQHSIDLLRETRQQLALAEKLAALGELTAGVAHEINNPIAVILGNIEIVQRELGEAVEPVRTEVDLVIEQVDRIRAIVDRLLQYSRPAQYAGYVEQVDPQRVVEDTLVLVRHELGRKSIRLRRDYGPAPPIQINPQELQQVLVNLIVNAVHSLPEGGLLELRTDRWEAGAVITVLDHGDGIDPDNLNRIFDPFFTRRGQGTGLGLSVSYGLVRHYGGRIKVQSRLGEWSRFDVYLRCEPTYEDDEEQRMITERMIAGKRA